MVGGEGLARQTREAAIAALVTLALAIPMVGLQTVEVGGHLEVKTRFGWVGVAVVVAFAGRFAMAYLGRLPVGGLARPMAAVANWVAGHALWLGVLGALLAMALPLMPFANRYVVDLGTTVLIYVMLGWGLNIVVGLAGLLDLGYVVFYAVGAYAFALSAQYFQLTFWEALPLAGALAAGFGILLGFPVLRLRGDYLAIVTLGFGEIIRLVLVNWYSVTGGPNGISNVPRPSFFGMPFQRTAPEGQVAFHDFFGLDYSSLHRIVFLYYLILLLALVTNLFTLRIRRLPIGRAWEALREDEIACRALGINPTNTKLSAFAIGAMFGGFAGAFFATRQGFISPESFTFIESALVLAIVVLGGMGSQIGVVIAALVLVMLPELGREFAEFRMLLFGGAMVAIMVWRPHGMEANREPTVRLHASRPGT